MPVPSVSPALSDPLRAAARSSRAELLGLLGASLRFESVSGQEGDFTRFICAWATSAGFATDLWQADEHALAALDPALAGSRHLPLAGRPTLVVRLPGRPGGGGRSLIFNAHADVVGAPDPDRWTLGPWGGAERDGRVYGRGACDVKGPLASALGAMRAIRAAHPHGLAGDVLLELIPGEEDCVGLGTLTSVARGYRADGVVILEPTEGLPRCASRGGCRFEIVCSGRAVHGTVKWLGTDAIRGARHVLDALDRIEARWNDRAADPLFAPYPIARPITVDVVHGGDWQGMTCDRCRIGGYLELLPGDSVGAWKQRFGTELSAELATRDAAWRDAVSVTFTEEYAGHRTPPGHPICAAAAGVVSQGNADASAWAGWAAFNSGCEAGLRAKMHASPTLVWGPGSLAQAHAVDEFVEADDVIASAEAMARFAVAWCGA